MQMQESVKIGADVQTYIAPVLPDEYWNQWEFGYGIDAITGGTKASAVEAFNVTPSDAYDVQFTYSSVSSDTEFERELGVQFSGNYNCGQHVTVDNEFSSKVSYSDTSVSIIARCRFLSRMFGE